MTERSRRVTTEPASEETAKRVEEATLRNTHRSSKMAPTGGTPTADDEIRIEFSDQSYGFRQKKNMQQASHNHSDISMTDIAI